MKNYTLKVKKNKEGELYIQLPTKLLKEMGWKIGDPLEWLENKDGSYTLQRNERKSKKEN